MDFKRIATIIGVALISYFGFYITVFVYNLIAILFTTPENQYKVLATFTAIIITTIYAIKSAASDGGFFIAKLPENCTNPLFTTGQPRIAVKLISLPRRNQTRTGTYNGAMLYRSYIKPLSVETTQGPGREALAPLGLPD